MYNMSNVPIAPNTMWRTCGTSYMVSTGNRLRLINQLHDPRTKHNLVHLEHCHTANDDEGGWPCSQKLHLLRTSNKGVKSISTWIYNIKCRKLSR